MDMGVVNGLVGMWKTLAVSMNASPLRMGAREKQRRQSMNVGLCQGHSNLQFRSRAPAMTNSASSRCDLGL